MSMEIREVHLRNIGRFESLAVSIAPTEARRSNVTVLVGNNGSGKTSILKAVATSLSWFVARTRSEKGSGTAIPNLVIPNSVSTATIKMTVSDRPALHQVINSTSTDDIYKWTIARTHPGRKADDVTHLTDATRLANKYREMLTADENANLPLIAFYPVERVVIDVPLKIRSKHTFQQFDGYDNSLSQGVDFRRFFEWFREREDTENETAITPETLNILEALLDADDVESDIWKKMKELNVSSKDRQLSAVRKAVTEFMPGFGNLKIRRKPRLHMSIDKDGTAFNVLQLSQGEKSLMALVGDIARRLAMMNPKLENPLLGDGVVLIDEIDMHLHPTWQRSIISRLTNTFKNCQFVVTTHSPLVISDCKDVLVYSLDDGVLTSLESQYGQDANTVLLDVMNTHIRNAKIAIDFNTLLDLIQDNDLDMARSKLAELKAVLPSSNMELEKAKLLLKKQELRSEKN